MSYKTARTTAQAVIRKKQILS